MTNHHDGKLEQNNSPVRWILKWCERQYREVRLEAWGLPVGSAREQCVGYPVESLLFVVSVLQGDKLCL